MAAERFPSMRGKALFRVLTRDLGYVVVRQKGSHRVLRAEGRPQLLFAFHDSETVTPGLVRSVLVKQAGLDESEALELL